MTAPIASTASAAPSPSAATVSHAPFGLHSKMTPITLLPFARWSSRSSVTSHG
jgi:hypothetical protein